MHAVIIFKVIFLSDIGILTFISQNNWRFVLFYNNWPLSIRNKIRFCQASVQQTITYPGFRGE
jgi:hypothetical protein